MRKLLLAVGLLSLIALTSKAVAQLPEVAPEPTAAAPPVAEAPMPEGTASALSEPDWLSSEQPATAESPMGNSGIRAGGALLAVVCLLWLVKVLVNRRGTLGQLGREPIQLLGVARLGNTSSVHLLEIEGRRLVVGASQSGVNLITILEKPTAREQAKSDRLRQPRELLEEEELLMEDDWPRAAKPRAATVRTTDRRHQETDASMEDLLRRKIAELRGRSATLA